MLLTLGYLALAVALILVTVNAADLHLAQRRLDALAASAALAGSDGFGLERVDGVPRALLTDARVSEQADAVVRHQAGASLVWAGTPDGLSARATVATVWHPIVLSVFVPDGVRLEATATSRNGVG